MKTLIHMITSMILVFSASYGLVQPAFGQSALDYSVSDGESVNIVEKGIAITPPVGWEVYSNYPNMTLFMQAPENKQYNYRRSIQIISFNDPQYIDELAAKNFDQVIVDRFSEVSARIRDYKNLNHLPVDLKSGVKGFLFYTEFKIGEVDLMQMHILISSAERHFLMTFTDNAEFFDSDAVTDDHLNEAWEALGSVELDSVGPVRLDILKWVLILAGLLAMIAAGGVYFRNKQAKKNYHDYADGNFVPEEGDEEELAMTVSPESITPNPIVASVHEATLHETELDDDDDFDNDFKTG